MIKKAIVSIIVPIYNVEKYIADCLNSIINQTYKDIEIICVDDCGNDNSMQIVNDFAKKDNRIKILSYGSNKGVSFARNYGLKEAKGEYIYFIDSDDWIDSDYIEKMVINIEDFDIIQSNNHIIYLSPRKIEKVRCKSNISSSACNKIYKKFFLLKNNISFPIGIKMGEDLCFNYHCFSLANRIKYYDNLSYYYYRKNENSATFRLKNENDVLEMFYLLFKILKNNNSLDIIALPLFQLRRHMKFAKNKNKMFLDIKEFFKVVQPFIITNQNIYVKKDLSFFNCVLNNKSYFKFKIKYIFNKIFDR